MLTCKNINAEQAKSYFSKGYYQQGRWFGQGAATLNLTGEIKNHETYNNLLDGYSPDRSQLLMGNRPPKGKHRAAIDCTFNAPKSVSLQALIAGDERLIEAHRTAVNAALSLMEFRYAHTRLQKRGQPCQVISTGQMAVAQFDHLETRDLDPHLHTHCVVMNVTPSPDGKWRSLHNDAIYRQQKLLGMVYQHHLAISLQKLGYQTVSVGNGQFEIVGYPKDDLVPFSKRRQAILAEAGEGASVEERNRAWANTRVNKEIVNPDQLKAKWKQEAETLGLKFVTPNAPTIEPLPTLDPRSLDDGIEHCSEKAVDFQQEDLEKFLLNNPQPIDFSQLNDQISQHSQLLNVSTTTQLRYTTENALQRELATINLMADGKGKVTAILNKSAINQSLESISLTEGQAEALTMALSTTDAITAWQGVAGAGKTYALNHFHRLATQQGYVVKGFAPSAEAAKVLKDEINMETDTVASLLCRRLQDEPNPNQIWIIDEAGLLSAVDAYQLLQTAQQQQARVLFVGDTRQLSAVEAGRPFKSLQAAGMTTAYMNQSLRQRTPQLKIAVDLIAKGEVDLGFNRLDEANCLVEVSEEDKIKQIVTDYLAIPSEQRDSTLILAGTNAERLAITQALRERLKQTGELGQTAQVSQLKTKDLTKVQKRYTHHFELGDVIKPAFDYKARQLSKNQLYQVIDQDDNTLTLQDDEGNVTRVDPLFEKTVHTRSQMEIAVGDRLKWTKNDRYRGRRNGQTFLVKAIDGHHATIEYDDGQQEKIDLQEAHHLDYALVATTYSSQGKTANNVLISADFTIGKESFYVAVSRVKENLKLYTTDKDELLTKAKESRAKENPLELIRRLTALNSQKRYQKSQEANKQETKSSKTQSVTLSTAKEPVFTSPQTTVVKKDEISENQTLINLESPQEASQSPSTVPSSQPTVIPAKSTQDIPDCTIPSDASMELIDPHQQLESLINKHKSASSVNNNSSPSVNQPSTPINPHPSLLVSKCTPDITPLVAPLSAPMELIDPHQQLESLIKQQKSASSVNNNSSPSVNPPSTPIDSNPSILSAKCTPDITPLVTPLDASMELVSQEDLIKSYFSRLKFPENNHESFSVSDKRQEIDLTRLREPDERIYWVLNTATTFLKDRETGKAHQFIQNGYAFQYKDNLLKIARPTTNGHDVILTANANTGQIEDHLTDYDYDAIMSIQQALDREQARQRLTFEKQIFNRRFEQTKDKDPDNDFEMDF